MGKVRFPVRFRVKVGTHPTVEELVAAVEASGGNINAWVRGVLPRVVISDPQILNVITPTVAELGFATDPTRKMVHNRGIKLGYKLVPPDLAFSLRLEYRDQSDDEVIVMAMDALRHPGGFPLLISAVRALEGPNGNTFVFRVLCDFNDGSKSIGVVSDDPKRRYSLSCRFAFVDPAGGA